MIRFLFIFLVGYVLLRVVNILVSSFKSGLNTSSDKKATQQNTTTGKSGRVTVDYNPQQGKKPTPKVGEYVDYEEVKEDKKA